jgi:type I restriction enzyme M protein
VLANPPFGKKSSTTFTNDEGEQEKEDLTYNRQDFWATTSNKQLNFVQHIRSMLKIGGRAAVVLARQRALRGRRRRNRAQEAARNHRCCTRSCACPRASSTPRA